MATITNQAALTYRGLTRLSNITVGRVDSGLAVDKNAAPAVYVPGERTAYTVSIVNSGASAASGLTFTDDLGGYTYQGQTLYPLTYVADSLLLYVNGVNQPAPEPTTTEPLVFDLPEIPAGGSAVVVYTALVNAYADPAATGSITNTVTVTGAAGGDAEASATVTAAAEPQLALAKEMDPVNVTGSQVVTYTITVENSGNTATSADDGVVVSDTFAPVLYNVAATLDGAPLTPVTDYTYDGATGAFATVAGVVSVPAAAFSQGADGAYTTVPGTAVLTISGTLSADLSEKQ